MFGDFGLPELVISFVIGLFTFGLPIAVIILLIRIYKKVHSIEKLLKSEK